MSQPRWSVSLEGFQWPASALRVDLLLGQLLGQLVDEELATLQDEVLTLPHETVAKLQPGERRALELPSDYPFDLELSLAGILADERATYSYEFVSPAGQKFIGCQRVGALLVISTTQQYLVSGELYDLLETVDSFNAAAGRKPRDAGHTLLTFSRVKSLAEATGARLDKYLRREKVATAEKLGVHLRLAPDGSLEVLPRFLGKCDDIWEGGARFTPGLDPDLSEAFVERIDRANRAKDVYVIPNGPRLVLDKAQQEAIEQFKRVRRVSGALKEELLAAPQNFFDPDTVDLEDFSARVLEIGEHRQRVFPFLRPQRESWIPPEGGIVIDGNQLDLADDEAEELLGRVRTARREGSKSVRWNGADLDASHELEAALVDLIEAKAGEREGRLEPTVRERPSEKTYKKVLIIRDNFDDTDFYPESSVRPGVPSSPLSLRDDVRLFPHQKTALEWLQTLWTQGATGALLADDMGLGKTLTALAFLACVHESVSDDGLMKPMLIVAPLTLLENWENEYNRFFNPIFGPMVKLHSGGLREFELTTDSGVRRTKLLDPDRLSRCGLVLTTYETLRDCQLSLGRVGWRVAVIDEAQKIKTPTALVTTAVKGMKYDFGLALTGTPVENTWIDLWSIIDFVQPGHLSGLKSFERKYQRPLGDVSTDVSQLGLELKEKIRPFLKRRLKEEHLEGLPKKRLKKTPVSMPDHQLERYLSIITDARRRRTHDESNRRHIFTTMGLLRDVSLSPHLPYYDDVGLSQVSTNELINSSARLLFTFQALEEIRDQEEKAIIFLVSRRLQRSLQRAIDEKFHVRAHIINGEVHGGRRQQLIDAFQATLGFNVIILSPEAAGVGLNVTAANHVIHLSRLWNPAKEDQATDRVYRIGQEKDVEIHIPLAVHSEFEPHGGTFDVKLDRLLDEKRRLSRSVLMPIRMDDDLTSLGDEIIGTEIPSARERGADWSEIIDKLAPENFERLLAALYRAKGYQAHTTPQTRDAGADVVALPHGESRAGVLIQCKHTSRPDRQVGPSAVQEIIGAKAKYSLDYNVKFKLVVATNATGFTPQAADIASPAGVSLVTREALLREVGTSGLGLADLGVSS